MKKIILLILNFCCFFASCQRTEPEVFIIPKGFKGKVMVVFEKKNGVFGFKIDRNFNDRRAKREARSKNKPKHGEIRLEDFPQKNRE